MPKRHLSSGSGAGRNQLLGTGNSTCENSEQEKVGVTGDGTRDEGLGAVFRDLGLDSQVYRGTTC